MAKELDRVRSRPSRHSETSRGDRSGGFDISSSWDDDVEGFERRYRELRNGGSGGESAEPQSGRASGGEISDRDGLEQELAMLLGGRRTKYATDMHEGSDPWTQANRERPYFEPGGHGAGTYSEQFTEPEGPERAHNAEEAALLRERDRLDPYGSPTRKMRLQDAARERIVEEYRRRRGGGRK